MTRLTKNHTRKGNGGFTELVRGNRLPKSDPLCFYNNEIQKAGILIRLWNKKYSLLDPVDLQLLSDLTNPEIGKLVGSLWAKLEMKELDPTEDLVNGFENRLSEINSEFSSAEEFVVFNSSPALELYYITLYLRNVEHFVWCIIHRYYSFDVSNFTESAELVGAFYNLLGDYSFNLCRLVEKRVQNKEEYWKNPLSQKTDLIVSD